MITLRPRWTTNFHRQLATTGWLDQARQSLESHPALRPFDYSGVLLALHTEARNLGPQSAIKYRFVARLRRTTPEPCCLIQTIDVGLVFLHVSNRFSLGPWRTRYRFASGTLRTVPPLIRCGLLANQVPALEAAAHQLLPDARTLAHESGVLALGLGDHWLTMGVRHLDQVDQLPAHDLNPVRAALLGKKQFRCLRAQSFGPSLRVSRVRVTVRGLPPAASAWDGDGCGDGYQLTFSNYAFSFTQLKLSVDTNQMQLQCGDRRWRVIHSPATWSKLEAGCLAAITAPQPGVERQRVLHGQEWKLTHGSAGERSLWQPAWGRFLQFAIANFRKAGVDLRVTLTPTWELSQ